MAAGAAPRVPPREPLVTIIGTTGTGKSDLAVDLAVRFNGEIINADAMQMYRGLPVITNQISLEEQRGIPHHLLAQIDPLEPTWVNGIFVREARRLIQEIRSRGKLPIVVGGTLYYVHALLFEGHQIDQKASKDNTNVGDDADGDNATDHYNYRTRAETESLFPILNQPVEAALEKLRQVDPAMAARWHPTEERRIKRSLEIYLTTGRKASDIYAEQMKQRADSSFLESRDPWENLVFWVYSDRDALAERLSRRVDKMVEAGLMDEVRELHRRRLECLARGEVVDVTRGIWQSIGYKQMEPFLEAEIEGLSEPELEKRKATGLEEIKIATRQYAKSQMKWIRIKSARAFAEHGATESLYLLDSTDPSSFGTNVLETAAGICEKYLAGDESIKGKGKEVSETARSVLEAFEIEGNKEKETMFVRTCEVCEISLYTANDWEKHLNGRNHRRVLKKKKRLALVLVEGEGQTSNGEPADMGGEGVGDGGVVEDDLSGGDGQQAAAVGS